MLYERVAKDDSPKGLWLLPETATTSADSSGNAQNGSIKGGPLTAAAGPIPELGAVTLNGTNQWISVPDSNTLDTLDTHTYICWYKRSATGGTDCLLDKGSGAGVFRFDGEDRLLARRNSVADIVKSTIKVTDTNWHMAAWTKAGAANLIYQDAVNVSGTVTNSTLVNTAIVLGIGASDAGTEDFFRGSLAGAAVYGTALSAARIAAIYDAGIRRLAMVI